jgi:tetratricopeptide (TPR) repeat protein
MHSGKFWQRTLSTVGVLLAVVALATPAFAQVKGFIRGAVTDEKGQPIQGAKITITRVSDSQRWATTSDSKGEYMQAGLISGAYTVLCEKEKIGSDMVQATVGQRAMTTANFKLIPGKLAPQQRAALGKAVKGLFDEALAARQAGNNQLAISKFNDMIVKMPNCPDCYYNIGISESELKDWGAAETAFKKAIELAPDYVEAYNGLTGVYNSEGKLDLAEQAAAKAVELTARNPSSAGGGAESLYLQGTILWNGGKIPEAAALFEQALKADPNYAPAHYHYGMSLLNQGKVTEALTEFETYVKLAPTGEYADQARGMIAQLKK